MNSEVDNERERSLTSSKKPSSRLPGFYELPISERLEVAKKFSGLTDQEAINLSDFSVVRPELTDVFIENAIGTFSLPLGVATNFQINGKDYLVPMAVEETSVLAAASHGAKLARAGGGFSASSTSPVMTGQIQLFPSEDADFDAILLKNRQRILDFANRGQERLISRGGGAQDVTWRYVEEIKLLIVHLHIDTRDAMGANIVNTMCERVSGIMPELFPCTIGLRILTNLADRRLARGRCVIPPRAFATKESTGEEVIERIYQAYLFAFHDIYRAATHNKGVMNGIDPVTIATGNDWRAVEAGAHAYAARTGRYRPLTRWSIRATGELEGEIELPMAVGTVGGVTKLHPTAQAALKLLGNPSASELAEIIACVGLAQNLSALRALATEGIQKGHMSLHQKNLDLIRQGATKL
jgi:hydroxymethylglutaryl-CoA reductase